jgi:ureidoacrylate peracid hydrolase
MPEAIPPLVPEQTALLVIDMQNGFCHPEGAIGRSGHDVSTMQATIQPVRQLIEACRAAGIIDIWTLQEHYPDDAQRFRHRIKPHTLKLSGGPPALVNTWDSAVVDELADLAEPPAELVRKHRFSGFLNTRLETLLRMKNIDMLLVCGVSTSLCVETTVRDAYQRDYDVLVASDAVGTSGQEAHQASLRAIDLWFGMCVPTSDMLAAIAQAGAPTAETVS